MKLLMYISNDLIDAVILEKKKITNPGYLRDTVRLLKKKHDDVIKQSLQEPEFILQKVSP